MTETPTGLCANKDDHAPHVHDSPTLGQFWCTADQTQRQPFKGEQEQKRRRQNAG